MSTYVVGDLQGCLKPLRKLLKRVEFKHSTDRLWCVGDLINRGPKSRDTLAFLQDMDSSLEVVLGNHDLHFLAVHARRAPIRGKDTLDELLNAPDCDDLAKWLRRKPLAHLGRVATRRGERDFLMVHAGVAPSWSLKKTLQLQGEVQQALADKERRGQFLKHIYGDTPRGWTDQLTGYPRLRVIVNYLTRVRFCDGKGKLRLDVKEGYSAAPKGCRPWFEQQRITPKATILFGHWAAIAGETGRDDVIALDTGYVWGGSMTMLRLEDGQRFRVSA